MQVFDTERKAVLLKQTASVRVDTNRGNKTFGLSDLDSLMEVVMGVWLGQRQAAMSELAMSWTAVEPVGGGVLAVNMDVDQLTKIAAHALGPGVLPNNREALLEVYFNTVQAARLSQATARVKWSGFTTAALGTALTVAELLPPRPLTPRGSPAVSRLNAAASLLFQIADPAADEMRSQPAFRLNKAMEALDVSLGRLRRALQACDREELGGPRSEAEEEEAVAAGWAAAEAATAALLAAREAYRGFEANVRDHMIKMAVDAALEKHRGENSDGRRMSNSRHRRASRNFRTSNLSNSGDGGPDGTHPRTSGRHSISGANSGPSLQGRLSARSNGRPSHRPLSGVAPRDLRAVLASAAWSSDGEDLTTGMSMDGGTAPPRLQLRGRSRMHAGPGESVVQSLNGEGSEGNMPSAPPVDTGGVAAGGAASAANIGAGGAGGGGATGIPRNAGGDGGDIAAEIDREGDAGGYGHGAEGDAGGGAAVVAMNAGGVAVTAATAKGDEDDGRVSGHRTVYHELDPDSDIMQRLAELEGKYVRLRSRHDETKRTIHAAYVAAAGSDPSGAGLPSPEVLAEMGPASKLRLVAELLAELHQEVEQGVWPQLDDTVRAAITSMLPRGGGGSRRQSRRSVSLVMPPGMRMTVRPSRLSSLTAVETLAAADTDVDFTTAAPARASSTVLTAAAVVTPLSPSGALGVQGSAVSSVMPAEGVEVEESVYDGVGMAVVDEEGQEGQDGADGGEEPHPAEVAEVAGRLHAHAGHVGQVMAAAAMETAALAAALEDLTSWKSSPSHSASTRWHSGTIGDGLFRNGSSEAAGNGYSSDSAAPPWAGNNLAGAEYGAPGGLLHRSNTLQRVQSVRVPPLPLGALGNWLHDSNNSARDSSRSSRSHSDGSGGGTVRTTSGAAALGEDVHMDPWDAVPVEADPRDTAYLDALRSLHMAAEAQSSTEGDIGVLVKAVQEVVRLLGGQPKITSNGRVIEFFPRRVPTDWRHPVLRSSLSRLYIYVSGALLQQHERAVLLREASADLAQRHAALSRTAEDLSAKAASLRSLEAALGAQLATLASFVSQGSVMVDSLGKLDTASEALQALVAAAQVTEYTPAPPPSPPSPSRVASAKPPVPVQLSRPSSVRGPSMLSRTSFSASASTAPLKGSAAAAPAGAPFAMNELAVATAAAAAAAAAATAVAYAASPAQHLTPAAAERSGSTVAAGDQAPPSPPFGAPSTASMSAALPASAPASILPPLSLGTSSRGPGKPLNKVVIFPQDNWEDMRGIMSIMMGALAQVRSATGRLAAMVRADDGEAQVTSTRAEGSDQALMPKFPVAASRLPSGDHILEVHVHLAGLNSCAAEFTAATSPESQQAGPAAAGTPGSVGSAAVTGANRDTATSCSDPVGGDPPRHQQQQQQRRQGEEVQQQQQLSLNFIVELPLPTARALSTAPHVAVSTSSAAAAATQVPTAQSAMTAAPGGRVDKPAAQAGAAVVEALADGEGDIRSIASDTDGESGTGGQRRGPSAEPTSACLLECPPAATPAVSPEASVTALPAPPGFYLRMALRRAHAVPGSNGGSDGGAGDADLSVLPPGEALVGLSNSMLKRSAMAAVRRHRGAVTAPTGGNGSHGRSTVSAATIATASAAAAAVLGPAPAHYESRPMTARAFVEGVMAQAREEQLQRLYGSAGPMPRGGLPEVEGIARMDEHEASLLMQRVLQLAGPHPEPVTALEALLWEHKEEAEAANAAAASAVADAVSSAAAAAGVAIAQEQQQEQQQRPSSALLGQGPVGPAGAALKRRGGRGLVLVRQQRARSPLRHPVELLDQNRLTVGVTGTRLSTLPPMAALGGGAVGGAGSDRSLSTRSSAHLGYFPGLQVDAGGRVIDWRLPLLVPFAPNQHALHRSVPVERR
ncbi:hypothetical protein Vretimale_4834 [Volvox reticuliferus]|nr:hypothetical protein Vretifemale_3456 [Volvox reticuliferus]GIL99690.1 hypothetical protein Vretimale_4834 [Volvox reticuliferus]